LNWRKRLANWIESERKKRVAVFVDYENIAHAIVEQGKILDLDALLTQCLELGNIEFSFLFVPTHMVSYYLPPRLNEKGFYVLACPGRKNGHNGSNKEKDRVDTIMTEIGYKLVEHSDIDIVVIVSHDGDFVRLANFARMHGKKVIAIAGPKISYLLKQVVEVVLPIPVKDKK